MKNLFSFKGRYSRESFAKLYLAVTLPALALIVYIDTASRLDIPDILIHMIEAIILIVGLSSLVLQPFLVVKRLHDVNASGGWFFLILIPILYALLVIILLLKRGQVGPNRFGEEDTAERRRAEGAGAFLEQPGGRPQRVTVIAWIIISIGCLGLFGVLIGMVIPASRQPLEASEAPIQVVVILGLIANAIHLTCGAGLLKGMNWSRWLWLLLSPVIVLTTVLIHGVDSQAANPVSLVFTVVLYVAALVALTSKPASLFLNPNLNS